MREVEPATHDLLERLDSYLDAVPLGAARPERIGALVLFVPASPAGWRYYARPVRKAPEPTRADVERTRARQRDLGLPEEIEWVHEVKPSLADTARAAGLNVELRPLMALDDPERLARRPAVVRLATADDDLALLTAAQDVGFGHAGTAVGGAGREELEAAAGRQRPGALAFLAERVRTGKTVYAAAWVDGIPVCAGAHQPVGDVTEVVGVATLPAYRRRGLGAAVTAALVADALERGVRTVFLSAAGEDVARMYESVGFRRVGSAGAAAPP